MIGSTDGGSVLLLPVPVRRRRSLGGCELRLLLLCLFRDLSGSLAFRLARTHSVVCRGGRSQYEW